MQFIKIVFPILFVRITIFDLFDFTYWFKLFGSSAHLLFFLGVYLWYKLGLDFVAILKFFFVHLQFDFKLIYFLFFLFLFLLN